MFPVSRFRFTAAIASMFRSQVGTCTQKNENQLKVNRTDSCEQCKNNRESRQNSIEREPFQQSVDQMVGMLAQIQILQKYFVWRCASKKRNSKTSTETGRMSVIDAENSIVR